MNAKYSAVSLLRLAELADFMSLNKKIIVGVYVSKRVSEFTIPTTFKIVYIFS